MPRNLILLLFVLLPAGAFAEDIRVTYLVDAKALKAAVAGTPLSFQLFAEGSCATPVATQVVSAESADLIEVIKPWRVKKGPKPLATARIQHVIAGVTPQQTFYLTVTGTGVAPIGGACQLQTASVGASAPPTPACPVDSVESGDLCVDKYEASAWKIPSGQVSLIEKVQNGTVTLSDLNVLGVTQLGVSSNDYGADCPAHGAGCTNVYAVSLPGVQPSRFLHWFQAVALCRNAGKHLPSSAEWQAAALGTPDPGATGDGISGCKTDSAAPAPTGSPFPTGSAGNCVSDVGISDAVGNVWEWAADWMPGGALGGCGTWGAFSSDIVCFAGAGSTATPTAIVRGGSFHDGANAGVYTATAETSPTGSSFGSYDIGVRCVR